MMNVDPLLRRYRTRITLLVPVILLAVAWAFGPRTLSFPWLVSGLVCVAAGMALRLWAAGYLVKDTALTTWGPFAHLRNPLYLGTSLLGIGYAALTGRWASFLLVALIIAAVYVPTVLAEETGLTARYGEPYEVYRRAVPRWLPRLHPPRQPAPAPFNWTLVKHHREHRHLLLHLVILLAFAAIYLLKGSFTPH
ncbi:MAG TPA: isoprenylcysteine carboxylmethyltransferase family protein [Armatimonadota bacterium]|jgi:protein-S-isoprenylcysteine O-methyltransferase Ste14